MSSIPNERISSMISMLKKGEGFDREENFQDKSVHFVKTIRERYPEFPDITDPFSASVLQLSGGLRLLASSAKCEISGPLSSVVSELLSFPLPLSSLESSNSSLENGTSLEIVRSILSPISSIVLNKVSENETTTTTTSTTSSSKDSKPKEDVHASLLKSALRRAFNSISSSSTYSQAINTQPLEFVLSIYAKEWSRRESARKKKEEEEAKEFEYKTRTVILDDTEAVELEEKEDLKAMFPDFGSTFDDITTDPLERQMKLQKQAIEEKKRNANGLRPKFSTSFSLTPQDLEEICSIHEKAFGLSSLTDISIDSSSNSNSNSTSSITSRKTILLNEMQTAAMVAESSPVLPLSLDLECSPILLVSAAAAQTNLLERPPATVVVSSLQTTEDGKQELLESVTECNIHIESHISEASLIITPLRELVLRVDELLKKYSGHTVLLQIAAICSRILSFPVSSPLMKFLNGLEILLGISQTWEDYSPKADSLKEHLEVLSRLVARWRKLELNSWPRILSACEEECAAEARKWWFHIFSTVIEGEIPQGKEEADAHVVKVCHSIDEFIQTSSTGEYAARLSLVRSFYGHIRNKSLSNPEHVHLARLRNALYNLYRYYAQYLGTWKARVETLRKDPQEKIKEVIQLCRWDKLSFFILKDNAERSHRKLLKLSKDYKIALKESAKCIFEYSNDVVDPDLEKEKETMLANKKASRGKKKSSSASSQKSCLSTMNENMFVPKESPSVSPLPSEFEKYFVNLESASRVDNLPLRAFELWKNKVSPVLLQNGCRSVTSDGILGIEDICTTIIERVKQLATMTSTDKKGANSAKRLAVKSLFRWFARAGLHTRSNDVSTEMVSLLSSSTPSDDISKLFSDDVKGTLNLGHSERTCWEKADSYFFRCMGKMQQLRNAITLPNKDLSRREVDLSSGYSTYLIHLLDQQRKEIMNSASHLADFAVNTSSLKEFIVPEDSDVESTETSSQTTVEQVIPPQKTTRTFAMAHDVLLKYTTTVISDMQLVVEALPTPNPSASANLYNASQCLIQSQNFFKKSHIENKLLTFTDVSSLLSSAQKLEEVGTILSSVCVLLPSHFVSTSQGLCKKISEHLSAAKFLSLNHPDSPLNKDDVEKENKFLNSFASSFDSIVKSIMLAFQSVFSIAKKESEEIAEFKDILEKKKKEKERDIY
eukprot:TRINITY_DN717_c0_g4_i2.p1 TRINITY_DN717_c0_g4~~TRINITY_DN717_c0_g4_i2.p1  ORF type:complete len:1246 (-),score=496.31 TRINITY_DN717_c0_g4_i2:64-3588(-)